MNTQEKPRFSRQAFWSDDASELDPDRDGDYIIQRVMDAGSYEDVQAAIAYYDRDRIQQALLDAPDLLEATVAWTALWLDLKPDQYRVTQKRAGRGDSFSYF